MWSSGVWIRLKSASRSIKRRRIISWILLLWNYLFNQKPNERRIHFVSCFVRGWGLPSTMYAVYRQAHTPTAVEFSVYCNFISSKEKNLVVAGTSQLLVYRIIHDVEVTYCRYAGSFRHCLSPLKGIFCDEPCFCVSFSECHKIRKAHRYGWASYAWFTC